MGVIDTKNPEISGFLLEGVESSVSSAEPRSCTMLNICDTCSAGNICMGANVCVTGDGGCTGDICAPNICAASNTGCTGGNICSSSKDTCADCSNCNDHPEADMENATIEDHTRVGLEITLEYYNPDSYAVSEALLAKSSAGGTWGRYADLETSSGYHTFSLTTSDYDERYFCIRRYNSYAGEMTGPSYYVEAAPPKPDYFYWPSGVKSGNYVDALTARSWNEFINTIQATLDFHYIGPDYDFSTSDQSSKNLVRTGSRTSYYDILDYCYVSSGDEIPATYFNTAKEIIGSFVATGLGTHYAEDIIYASRLIKLQDCLNDWIG